MTKPKPIPIAPLAAQIEAEHAAALGAARSAIKHAIRCGELLTRAKAEAGHGGWLAWVEANLTISARQCQKYMRLSEHTAELPNANSDFAYLSIDDALAALRCACDGHGRLDESHLSAPKPLRPAPTGTADLSARRHYGKTKNEAIDRLANRMQDITSRHGYSAVVAAQSRYRVPVYNSIAETLAKTRLALDKPVATLPTLPKSPATPIVTITPDMIDPVLRVRGLLEQALRVVEADGAFQATIRARLVDLIDAVKAEGATRPIRLPLQRP
jgi:Protein of unknown function (DUF3102)